MRVENKNYATMARLIVSLKRDAGLSTPAIKSTLPRLKARLVHLDRHELIAQQGEEARDLGLVVSGHLHLHTRTEGVRTILMRVVRTGEYVGHSLLFKAMRHYPCDVHAFPAADVLLLDLAAVRAWMREPEANPFCRMLEDQFSRSLTVAWQRNMILSQQTIAKRILTYLTIRCIEDATREVRLPGTLVDFADFLGCDRAALVRTMTGLCAEGKLRRVGVGCLALGESKEVAEMTEMLQRSGAATPQQSNE